MLFIKKKKYSFTGYNINLEKFSFYIYIQDNYDNNIRLFETICPILRYRNL